MRMVKREDCKYTDYSEMMDYIDRTAPYGVISCRYNPRLRIGFIYFWDSDYIPKDWEQWVVRPVSKNSTKVGVSEEHDQS